jgi:cytochrome c-type biogenesis protein
LTSILLLAGTEATVGRGVALLTAYAAGIGIPFLAAALFTGPFLRVATRFRAHLPIVEKVTGMVLVGTGLLVLVGAMPVIGGWLLEYAPILGRIG